MSQVTPSGYCNAATFTLIAVLIVFTVFTSISSYASETHCDKKSSCLIFKTNDIRSVRKARLMVRASGDPHCASTKGRAQVAFPSSNQVGSGLSRVGIKAEISCSHFRSMSTSKSCRKGSVRVRRTGAVEEY